MLGVGQSPLGDVPMTDATTPTPELPAGLAPPGGVPCPGGDGSGTGAGDQPGLSVSEYNQEARKLEDERRLRMARTRAMEERMAADKLKMSNELRTDDGHYSSNVVIEEFIVKWARSRRVSDGQTAFPDWQRAHHD